MLSQITDEPTRNRISGETDGQVVMVLYPGPLTGYPPKYPRDSIPVIKSYPDGTSWTTPSKVDFTPGQMLGCGLGARGLRKFFEEGGHALVLTSDKDGPDSEFERERPDAPPAALEAAYYAQRRRPAAS